MDDEPIVKPGARVGPEVPAASAALAAAEPTASRAVFAFARRAPLAAE
jgi:hypothetical protein